ncbi:MAG: DNA polymerase I [Prevotellaceae bacterium]|jgi:DNA polymerase-1|nr:DNA polymerase I [Prevotellaceae bacterium]
MKKLYLLDGHALAYRMYYAFMRRPITNSKGTDTSILYGFMKTLMELVTRERPSHLGVAFDPGGKTFRHDMYPAYKANRQPTPEIIRSSLPLLYELIAAFRIPLLILPGYEADDVVGTMAKRAEREGFDVYMLTPDKDYTQLVSPHINVMKPQTGGLTTCLGMKEICELYEIQRPEQVIDILAIWGDKVDNVPGVEGVGEVKAKRLVHEYGSVENIYANLSLLPEKMQAAFVAAAAQIPLSKQLVTIDVNVPVAWDEEALAMALPDVERVRALFATYEFASLLPHLSAFCAACGGGEAAALAPLPPKAKPAVGGQLDLFAAPVDAAPVVAPVGLFAVQEAAAPDEAAAEEERALPLRHIDDVPHTYHVAQSSGEVAQLVAMLQSYDCFCFDTETTGVEAMTARLVGMSFAVAAHEAWYVPVPPERDEAVAFLQAFRPLFASAQPKIGQNVKYDMLMLKQYGVEVGGFLYDTMLMHYLLDPESRHNMNVLSRQFLNYAPVDIEELIGKKGVRQGSMADVPLEKIAAYAAEDADVTFQLKEILEERLKEENLFELYCSMEAPLIGVLADMEYEGVRIDAGSLLEYGKKLQADMVALEEDIRQLSGVPDLNISSPKQLGVVLFEKMGIDAVKRTKTKQYSTDEDTLQSMADRHPIIPKILEFRSLKKLLSGYIEALPDLVNARTGRIHTTYNQFVTATGRLSSNNPNLQNVPVRDAKGREIRKAFVPRNDKDYVILSADYSQIELRLMAHMSGDRNMIDAFKSNADIHTATAAKVFHVPIDEVTAAQRSRAKTANFGIIYGISAFGLAQRLQLPRSEAKALIDGYFATYPDVKKYMDSMIESANAKGYVETIFGRIRHLREIHSQNAAVRGFAQRNAINAPIQGSAADIIKMAMITIHRRLKEKKLQTKMILQVHDELIFDVFLPELDDVKQFIQNEMEHVVSLQVPIIVEPGVGKNWLEAH